MAHKNEAAWITSKGAKFEVKEAPLWTPKANEVLIRNHAVAINPVDWKVQEGEYAFLVEKYPTILGTDIAGIVEAVGENVKDLAKGDRVVAYASSLGFKGIPEYAAFQNYTLVLSHLVTQIPESHSFEEASVLPLALVTVAHGFYDPTILGLERPTTQKNPILANKSLLVWGGASSLGAVAIQLAANAGYTVITTASKANHDFVLSLGASKVFDYNEPDVIEKMKAAVKGEWVGAYDAITANGTTEQAAAVIEKGVVAVVLFPPKEIPAGITYKMVIAPTVATTNIELGTWLFREYLPVAIKNRQFKYAPPPHVVGRGLDKLQDALSLQKTARAKKIVVQI